MYQILIIDNNDSFTYNLVELLRQTKLCIVEVILLEQLNESFNFSNYHGIILSPGPGLPKEKVGLFDIIKTIEGAIPLLGVCLGHQAIAQYFGASIYQLKRIIHGEASKMEIVQADGIYTGINKNIDVGRYHSWAVSYDNFPEVLEITAAVKDEIIMSFKHKTKNIIGVQFHPESILTQSGAKIIKNWLISCVKNNSN